MSYKDLKTFLNKLDEERELVRIKSEVNPYLEISEIANRV